MGCKTSTQSITECCTHSDDHVHAHFNAQFTSELSQFHYFAMVISCLIHLLLLRCKILVTPEAPIQGNISDFTLSGGCSWGALTSINGILFTRNALDWERAVLIYGLIMLTGAQLAPFHSLDEPSCYSRKTARIATPMCTCMYLRDWKCFYL